MSALLSATRSLATASSRCAVVPGSVLRPALSGRLGAMRPHYPRHMTKAADAAASPSTSQPAGKDDVSGPMLEPSAANNTWVRAAAVAAAVAVTAGSTTIMPSQGANFVHLLAFGTLLGTNLWNSFFVGLTMFKNMPRQMFGRVQSKLFPQYFALTSGASALLLGTLIMGGTPWTATPVITLATATSANLLNWLWIEPVTTKLMFDRYAIENKEVKTEADQADIKRLYGQFGKWHGISSLNNLVVLVATFVYGWTLSGKLAL